MIVGPSESTKSPKLILSRRRFSFTTTSLCAEHARRTTGVRCTSTDRRERIRTIPPRHDLESSADQIAHMVELLTRRYLPLDRAGRVRWGYSFLGGIGIAPKINAAFAPGAIGNTVVSVQSAATAVALDALAEAPGRCYGEEYQQGEAPVHNPRTLHAPEWFHQPRTAARCVNREAVQFGQKAEVSLLRPKRRQIGVTVPSVWILKGAPLTPPCFKVASHTASEPFE